MTRHTVRLAVLSLALTSFAVDASAAGLFGSWRSRSEENETPTATSKRGPSVPNGMPTDLNSAILQAQLSRKMGDFPEATKILGQLVLFAPDDPRVIGEYGKTLAAQGRADDALAFLDRAIQLQPGEWSLHSALGVAHDQKGDYKLAQASYDRALILKPGEPAVLNNAALSYLQSGNLETAERMLQQARATNMDPARLQQTVALVERARAANPRLPAPAPIQASVTPPPVVMASVAPVEPLPTVLVTDAVPAPVIEPIVESTPVDSVSLPPPETTVAEAEADTDIEPQEPTPPATVASLQANPTVVMQAVPKDDLAGPTRRAEPKAETPAAPKQITAAPPAPKPPTAVAAPRQLAVSANPPLTRAPQTPQTAQAAAPAPQQQAAAHAYYVQAGAFATEDRADKMAATLDSMGARVSPTTVGGRSLYRVRIGPFKDSQQANDALNVAKSMGHADVKVVSE